jgi:hypothetical protein
MLNVVKVLKQEQSRLRKDLAAIERAIDAVDGVGKQIVRTGGRLSAAGRKRISRAMKARWAKIRAKAKKI